MLTVKGLIKQLEAIEDKSQPVCVTSENDELQFYLVTSVQQRRRCVEITTNYGTLENCLKAKEQHNDSKGR